MFSILLRDGINKMRAINKCWWQRNENGIAISNVGFILVCEVWKSQRWKKKKKASEAGSQSSTWEMRGETAEILYESQKDESKELQGFQLCSY